jgi:hypothetical protein
LQQQQEQRERISAQLPGLIHNVINHPLISHYRPSPDAENKWCGCIGHSLVTASPTLWNDVALLTSACTQAVIDNLSLFHSTFPVDADLFIAHLHSLLACVPTTDVYSTITLATFLNKIMHVPTQLVSYSNSSLTTLVAATRIQPTTIVCGITNGKWYPFNDTATPCQPIAALEKWFWKSRHLLTIRHHKELESWEHNIITNEMSNDDATACIAAARTLNIHDPAAWFPLSSTLNRHIWLVTGVDDPQIVGVAYGSITTSIPIQQWHLLYSKKITYRDVIFVAPQSKSNPSLIMISQSSEIIDDKILPESKDRKLGKTQCCIPCLIVMHMR